MLGTASNLEAVFVFLYILNEGFIFLKLFLLQINILLPTGN